MAILSNMRVLLTALIFWTIFCGIVYASVHTLNTLKPSDAGYCEPHQCRFWGMISYSLPESVALEHLINAPYSLKNLGASNRNGWGLAYYNDAAPVVMRGELPANLDPNFTMAAQELAGSNAHIGLGHVRAATSGATDIPNPHPFIRYKGGKWWAFGHNGWLSKEKLKELIGSQYLAENPPTVGDNWDDPNVVDSDLYMLYVIKCIEECNWNVTQGIAKAVIDITQVDYGIMNFFLSDGETLWGFRKGATLYYYHNGISPQYSVIASQPPTSDPNGWIPLNDYNLVILTVGNPPLIIEDVRNIPEFPVNFMLPFFILATLMAVVLSKTRKRLLK